MEPIYSFTLAVPQDAIGRAMTDLKQRFGKFDTPKFVSGDSAEGADTSFTEGTTDMAILRGTAPVATMQDYSTSVHAYTKGRGHLTLELAGYDVCHNSEEVVARIGYDSEADTANPTGSVFCAHGAGFVVPWDQVLDYMHLDYVYTPDGEKPEDGFFYDTADQTFGPGGTYAGVKKPNEAKSQTSWELDKELQQIRQRVRHEPRGCRGSGEAQVDEKEDERVQAERGQVRQERQSDLSGARPAGRIPDCGWLQYHFCVEGSE